jgi:hypothetical protein
LIEPLLPKHISLLSSKSGTHDLRKAIVSQLLETVIFPPVGQEAVKTDVSIASLHALNLFLNTPKLPAEAALIIQPTLSEFCSLRLDLPLVEALSRTADLFPSLFNQRFCVMVGETLKHFVNPSHALSSHNQAQPIFVKLLQILCSICRLVDCSALVNDVCQSVAVFIARCEGTTKLDSLELLLRFISHFPQQGLIALVKLSNQHDLMSQLKVYAPHSQLWCEFMSTTNSTIQNMSSFYRNPELSDITFVLRGSGGQEECVPACKIILQLRCPFFKCMFSTGFSEKNLKDIHLGEIDTVAFDVALKHIHGIECTSATLSVDLVLRVIAMADFLGLDDLHRQFERVLSSMLTQENLHCVLSSPFIASSSCWNQSSALHLSPLADKCRRMILDHLYERSVIDLHDKPTRELVCFGL